MASHALRRLLTTLAVLIVVSLLSFVLAEATVDPAVGLAGAEATSADVEAARRQHGLDRPWSAGIWTGPGEPSPAISDSRYTTSSRSPG